MNNQIVYNLYYDFRAARLLRPALQLPRRRSLAGRLSTTARASSRTPAAALDWAQSVNPDARSCWIAGVSFGAWIGMQLLMRRPEIEGFISIGRHGQPLRLQRSSLRAPSSGLFRPRLGGPGRAGEGGDGGHREGEDAEGHPDSSTPSSRAPTTSSTARSTELMDQVGVYLDKRVGSKTQEPAQQSCARRGASERGCRGRRRRDRGRAGPDRGADGHGRARGLRGPRARGRHARSGDVRDRPRPFGAP